MKKYGKIIVLLTFLVFCPKSVKALLCENEEKVRWQALAQNVNVSYDAVEEDGKVTFTVTFSNLVENMLIVDEKTGREYPYTKPELTITGLRPNTSYRYGVYTSEFRCSHQLFYTLYANIPPYNPYHNDEVCQGIETYKLCQKWTSISYTYDEWKQEVNKYKENLEKNKPVEENERKKSLIDKIVDFYSKTYYIILPIVIILGGIIIYVYNKRRDLF